MLKKRNFEESKTLHEEAHRQYQIQDKIEEATRKTAELEDRLALAEILLRSSESKSLDKIADASEVLRDKSEKIRDVIGGWRK